MPLVCCGRRATLVPQALGSLGKPVGVARNERGDRRPVDPDPDPVVTCQLAAGGVTESRICWRNANARHPDLVAAQRRERAASEPRKAFDGDDQPQAPPDHRERLWSQH